MRNFALPNMEEEKTVIKTYRLKTKTCKRLEEAAQKTNISINRLVSEFIEFGLDNLDEYISNQEKDTKD